MLTKAFWKGAAERALKTFLQTFFSSLLIGVGGAATAWEIEWLTVLWAVLGVSVLATVTSLATSLGNTEFVAGNPDARRAKVPDHVPDHPAP